MRNRLAKLALAIGRESARREVEWMKRSQPANLVECIDRRITGEPLQYILGQFTRPPIPALRSSYTGTSPFGPLDLLARPPTLIPRTETEDWVIRLASTRTPSPTRPARVLDLCTGSGCIPLLLCHLWPPASTRAVGVDISPDAVRLAADNTARSRTHERQNTFTPLLADIHDPHLLHRLDPPFDIITANPPYIPLHEYHALPVSVKDYEDPRALIGDTDGLAFYRTIAALLARDGLLAPHASIALEIGHDQARAVTHILRSTPGLYLGPIEIWKDPWDKDRVVFARVA